MNPQYYKALPNMVYTGSELNSAFCYRAGLEDWLRIVAFAGPMHVATADLVDNEDRIANDSISSRHALNFVIQVFGADLFSGVMIQRLFARTVYDVVFKVFSTARNASEARDALWIRGDDIYYKNVDTDEFAKKCSVSIAAPGPNCVMIHFALNLTQPDYPRTAGLEEILEACECSGSLAAFSARDIPREPDTTDDLGDFAIPADAAARTILNEVIAGFIHSMDSIRLATYKVLAVP